jgi:hypothetical protein
VVRSGDDLNDGGPSDGIGHKDEGGSKRPRGGGRKGGKRGGKKGGKKGGKPTEGGMGSDGIMVMAVDEIAAKVCVIQCFNDAFHPVVHVRELWNLRVAVGLSWCTSNMTYMIHLPPPPLFAPVQMDRPLSPSLHGKLFDSID